MSKSTTCSLTLALLTLFATLAPHPAARAAGDDAKSVTAAVDRLLDAWNRRDGAKFAAEFTDDGDFVETHGGPIHGRARIAETVAKLFKQAKAQNRATRGQTGVKMVKQDVALVFARLTVTSGSSAPGGALATFVLVHAGAKWQISALEVATGLPAPPGKRPKRAAVARSAFDRLLAGPTGPTLGRFVRSRPTP